MHGDLATLSRNIGADCYRVGGTADHVHLAVTLPRTLSQADLIEEVKKKSSGWVHLEPHPMLKKFKWQRGYAGFSVSPSQLGKLVDYIDNQEEHHRHETFQDEYRRLLRLHEVDFDERWVWD